MRTITYSYDESKPTNKDYLIAVLTDSIDNGGASYESVAEYDIDCPYVSSADCLSQLPTAQALMCFEAGACGRKKKAPLLSFFQKPG